MKTKLTLSELYIHYSIDPKDFTLHPIQATRADHIEEALERSKELISSTYVHTLPFKAYVDEAIERAAEAIKNQASTPNLTETAEELWDKYSEYIGETIDDLQQVAGTTIMKRSEFIKALTEDHTVDASKLQPIDEEAYRENISKEPYEDPDDWK